MVKLTNDQIKEELLKILKEFSDFCDKNQIRYYMAYGTLLGAVRHKGFIPWDDDIDVLVPRPDYERMKVLLSNVLIKDRYKLCIEENNYYYPFAKICDIKTNVISEFTTSNTMLWIDIFPLDGLPEDAQECKNLLENAKHQRYLISSVYGKFGEGRTKMRAILKTPALIYAKFLGAKHFGNKMEQLCRKYDYEKSKYVGNLSWCDGSCERMKKSDFNQSVDLEFCGYKFHAPKFYIEYLKSIYGNYMKLPPENERISHNMDVFMED